MKDEYVRAATLIRVVDGDTIWLVIDLGFRLTYRARVRFMRINAPELSTQEGKDARDFLKAYFTNHAAEPLVVQTHKNPDDKYDRWLAEVWLGDNNLNTLMAESGHAEYKSY